MALKDSNLESNVVSFLPLTLRVIHLSKSGLPLGSKIVKRARTFTRTTLAVISRTIDYIELSVDLHSQFHISSFLYIDKEKTPIPRFRISNHNLVFQLRTCE